MKNQKQFTPKTTCSELRIASISDIHLGHPRNNALYIVKNLFDAFPDNVETGKLNIILIAGDLYDRALMLNDESISEIDSWFVYILRLCVKYDIMLVVLEGTPSHDRGQPKRIRDLNKIANINANMIYVNELSIVYINKFDINVLFVPDECRPTTDLILEDVMDLMREHKLDKVDYAFMHGTFDYQVPAVAKCPKHNSNIYLNIVDKLIFIGHDHTRSSKDRIFAQGSFDRNTHGDEIPKGHYRAVVRSGKDFNVTFVENKNARSFVTIDVSELNIESTILAVDELVHKLNNGSFIRVKASKGHSILGSMLMLERKWPLINWSKLEVVEDVEKRELDKIDVTVYQPVTITSKNIVELFLTKALNMNNVDDEIILMAEKKLVELK